MEHIQKPKRALRVYRNDLKGKSGVYVIRNLINNKAYIGSAINLHRRRIDHFKNNGVNKSHNKYLNNSFAKNGKDNFVFEVLTYVENKQDLTIIETKYIQLFETYNRHKGYNIVSTGFSTLGHKHTEETKQKISNIHKGKIISAETKRKLSKSYKTRIYTDITRQKQKMNQPNSKSVVQLTLNNEFVNEYYSLNEAHRQTKISPQGISDNCRKKYKTAGGYKWMYSEEYYNNKLKGSC